MGEPDQAMTDAGGEVCLVMGAALLIGLGLLTVGYWGTLGWAIWWPI